MCIRDRLCLERIQDIPVEFVDTRVEDEVAKAYELVKVLCIVNAAFL